MKQFLIIGNMNAITYKEVFPLIKSNQMWMGFSISGGDREFEVPDSYPLLAAGWRVDKNGKRFLRVKGVRWFTNIDHGRRHQPLQLMTMADNLKFSKHKEIKGSNGYQKYDNYEAIEVSFTDAIPIDYEGVMGVPISFLDKYCPEQFEIIGGTANGQVPNQYKSDGFKVHHNPILNGIHLYQRIFISTPKGSVMKQFLSTPKGSVMKQFLLVGNKNCVTYKEVFPLIKSNKMWVGTTSFSKDMLFIPPAGIDLNGKSSTAMRIVNGNVFLRAPSVWFTNINHGRRHQPLQLMTMADNLKFSKHKEIKGASGYQKYDNYDAIEVPYTDAIPSDYDGVMGVPISFLDKYCPEQFEIIGCSYDYGRPDNWPITVNMNVTVNKINIYKRIFIQRRKEA